MLGHGLEDCMGHKNTGWIVPLAFRPWEQSVSKNINMGAISWSVFDSQAELGSDPFVPGDFSLFCLTLLYSYYWKFSAFPLPHYCENSLSGLLFSSDLVSSKSINLRDVSRHLLFSKLFPTSLSLWSYCFRSFPSLATHWLSCWH